MSKYLITGRPGCGKSTTIHALAARGYIAYNTDNIPGITRLEDKATREEVTWPEGQVDWKRYAWNWQEKELKQLLKSDDTIFVGAVVGNQEEFYPLFNKVFVLMIDPETLRQRLLSHEHEDHHNPKYIKRMVSIHLEKQDHFIQQGCVPISAVQPVDRVVDEILAQTA
jgi:broad-specificity NMP kinase